MIAGEIDISSFFNSGYAASKLTGPLLDELYAEIKDEMWVDVTPRPNRPRKYVKRSFAARSLMMPNESRDVYVRFVDLLKEWLHPLMSNYDGSHEIVISATCGRQGYSMTLHNDVGDRCVLDFLLYLNPAYRDENDGGILEVYHCNPDNYKMGEKQLLARIEPTYGNLVIMNNLDPSFHHMVTEVTQSDAYRYSLMGSYGMISPPDWHVDIKDDVENKGVFVNPESPVTMEYTSDVVAAVNAYITNKKI